MLASMMFTTILAQNYNNDKNAVVCSNAEVMFNQDYGSNTQAVLQTRHDSIVSTLSNELQASNATAYQAFQTHLNYAAGLKATALAQGPQQYYLFLANEAFFCFWSEIRT